MELSGTPESKGQAIDQMVELMAKGGNINDLQRYKEGVLKREEEGTTGIGEGIAIPHAKTDAVSAPGLAADAGSSGWLDMMHWDGQPVHMIFFDRSTEYRRECASGSTQPSFHAFNG